MKYIDLYEAITESDYTTPDFRMGVVRALNFLDRNPDQAPGPTITAERYRQVHRMDGGYIRGYESALDELGGRVLEDPVPTNAEKLETEIRELFQEPSQSFSIARDLAEKLDKAGWTKAPGGDDD